MSGISPSPVMAVLQRSNGPSESTSNQIIIGVVVGGFVVIVRGSAYPASQP